MVQQHHSAISPTDTRRTRGVILASAFGILLASSHLQAGGQIPGDCTQDGALDLSDAVCLLGNLFLGSVELPCANTDANEQLLDSNGKFGLEIGDAVFVLGHLFNGGPPPVLGLACVEIAGCPVACDSADGSSDPSEVEVATLETTGAQRTVMWQLAEGPISPVTYEIVDGLAITEGDIVLGTAEELAALPSASAPPAGGVQFLSVVVGRTNTWRDAIVPYTIVENAWGNSTEAMRDRIDWAIEHVEEHTNVRFVPRRGETGYVEFKRTEKNCSATVGYQGKKQGIRLSTACGRGSIVHELAHAVGVWHEQSRCDRDDFVEILWDNIVEDKEGNFETHCSDGIDLGDYDFGSIMHYGARAFGKIDPDTGRKLETIRALDGRTTLGQRRGLSDGDIEGINWLYPTPPDGRQGTVGARTDTYDWTSGWTQSKSFGVGGEQFLFLLKESTGDVHIHRLEEFDVSGLIDAIGNDLPNPVRLPGRTPGNLLPGTVPVSLQSPLAHSTVGEKVADYEWSSGWTTVEFYELNLRTFLILLKESTGEVHIHRMNSDGTVGARTDTRDWSSGWTQAKPFKAGFRQYLFLLKEGNGVAHVHALRDDGTIGSLEEEYDWSGGWTSVEFYRSGGETYLLLLKEATGDVHVQKMLPSGAVGPRTDTHDWSSGWTSARTYVVDGSPYLFLLKANGGRVHVHELLRTGEIGAQLFRYDWSSDWSSVEFFELAGRTYLFLLKEKNGRVHMHTMND